MKGFMSKLGDGLGALASFMNTNKYLTVIKDTFAMYMPFVIVGSFANLFVSIICSETVGLASFEALSFLSSLEPAFSALNFACMTAMTLPIVFIIGMKLGKENGVQGYTAGLVALICYISVVPQSVTVTVEGAESLVSGVLPTDSINASGLFLAFVIGIASVAMFSKLMQFEKIKIKMPAQVPTAISASFNSIIPVLITLFFFAIAGTIFVNVTGSYMNEIIYSILQVPLQQVAQTPFGIAIIITITNLLWCFGIHGGMVTTPITNPLFVAAIAGNIAAVEAGMEATNVFTVGFYAAFINAGGAGITISLIVAILLFSKRQDYRAVAKLSILPGLCSINEPIIFGLPIVLNPILAIPFILAPLVTSGIGYLAIYLGLIPCSIIDSPFGVPIFVRAFMSYPGFNIIWISLLVFVVAFLIYLPFVLISNRQYEKELAEQAAQEALKEGQHA